MATDFKTLKYITTIFKYQYNVFLMLRKGTTP